MDGFLIVICSTIKWKSAMNRALRHFGIQVHEAKLQEQGVGANWKNPLLIKWRNEVVYLQGAIITTDCTAATTA